MEGLTPPPESTTCDFDTLKAAPAALRALSAPFARPGWVVSADIVTKLDELKVRDDGDNRYLASDGLLEFDPMGAGGTLLSFPFSATSQLPPGTAIFGSDWSELWIGLEADLMIEVSSEASFWTGDAWVSSFQNRLSLFRAVMTLDCAARRPQLFVALTDLQTT